MKVRDVMSTPIITEDGDTTVDLGASILEAMGVGSLVVTEDGVPVGIVTERDMALKVLSKNRPAAEVKLKEIMSFPLITIDADASVDDAGKLMAEKRVRRLLVEEDGEIVGIVTVRDLLTHEPELVEEIYVYTLKAESREVAVEKCKELLGKLEKDLGELTSYYEKDEELRDILTKVESLSKRMKEMGAEAIEDLKKESDALLTDLRHIIRWRKLTSTTSLGGELPFKSRRTRI